MTVNLNDNDMRGKLENAAAYIVETSARETMSGNYITYPEEMPAEIIPPELYKRHIGDIVKIMRGYESVADVDVTADGTVDICLYLDYCPNYEPCVEECDEYPGDRKILDPMKLKTVLNETVAASSDKSGKLSLTERIEEGKRRAAQHEKPENTQKIMKQGVRE